MGMYKKAEKKEKIAILLSAQQKRARFPFEKDGKRARCRIFGRQKAAGF